MNHCKLKAQYIVILALLLILPIGYGIMNPHMVQAAKKTKNSIQKKKITLYVGQSAKLRVIGAKKVKWKSSNKKVASVSSKGTVRAKKKGKATITATVKKQKLKCVVTVKPKKKSNNNSNNAPTNDPTNNIPTNDPTNKTPIPATSIQLNKKRCYINKGATLSLTATVSPFNTTQTVTWSSDKPSIASVNQRGMVTGLQVGTATIQVKVGNLTDYCVVEIINANDPSYAFSMPNETEEDCEGVYVTIKNEGKSIMRIYSEAMLIDSDYETTDEYNRELVLIDYNIYKTEGRIEEIEYIDISPNQTTTLLFLIDGEPTRYKGDTFVYFIFEYDEKLYLHVGSYDTEGTCIDVLNEDADFIYVPLIQ